MKKLFLLLFLLAFSQVFSQIHNQINFNNSGKSYLYRSITSAPSLIGSGDFTVEMWVNIPGNSVNTSDFFDLNALDENNNLLTSLSLGKNGDELHLSLKHLSSQNSANSQNLLIDGWNHIAMIRASNDLYVMINGNREKLLNITSINPDFSRCLLVINASNASGNDTSSANFSNVSNVTYDEIRIWKTARTDAEIISNLYNQISINQDLSAYFTFDSKDLNSGVVADLAPNNFNLTIYGNPTLDTTTAPVYDGGTTNNVLYIYTNKISSDIVDVVGDLSKGGSAMIQTLDNNGITGTGGVEKIYGKSWIIENRLLDSSNLTFTINDLNKLNFDNNKLVLIEGDDPLFLNPTIHIFQKDANNNYTVNTIFGDSEKARYYAIGQSLSQNPKLLSSRGFGPFYQDEPLSNTFAIINLPNGINSSMFYVVDRFGGVLDSIPGTLNSSKTQISMTYDMGDFPVNALLLVKLFYDNGPAQGLNFIKDIQMISIVPRITIDRTIEGYDSNDLSLTNKLVQFNSYKLGDTSSTITIVIDSLPSKTTKVILSITDANDNNICYFDTLNVLHCDTFTRIPDPGKLYIDNAVWTVKLDTAALQLSSKVGVKVYHKKGYSNGSLFTFPLKIYPPDMKLLSTNGWVGTTNNYQFNTNVATPWEALKDAYNIQFSSSQLPPQTRKVIYSIIDVDSNVVWADTVSNTNNRPMEGALSSPLNFRNLDIDALRLNMKIFAMGAPKQGLNLYHDIVALPQYPRISPTALGQYIVRDQADSNDTRSKVIEIRIEPSTLNTDSVRLSWIDKNYKIYFTEVFVPQYDSFCECNLLKFDYDVLSLPYAVTGLNIQEYYKGAPVGGLDTTIAITLLPPPPKSSALYTNNFFINDINFYQRWSFSNLPEKSFRTIINIADSTKNQIVRTDTIYPDRAPYDYSVKFMGDANIKSSLVKNLNEFTVMGWFNTSTDKGGVIMNLSDTSMTPNINVFFADSGYVCFSMYDKSYQLKDIGNTLYRYNNGKWHHLAVVLRKQDHKYILEDRLEVYIDGGLVETYDDSLDAFQKPLNGHFTLGYGTLPTSDPNYPTSLNYSGSLSDFRLIGKALTYDDIMQVLIKNQPIDTSAIKSTALWWKLNDVGQSTVNDYNGNNNGTVTGTLNWSKSLYQTNFDYFLNTKNLPKGKYYVAAIPQYFGGPDTPYSYNIDSLTIKSTLDSSNIIPQYTRQVDLRLTNGLGYYEQGDITMINIQSDMEVKDYNAGDHYGLAITIINPDGTENQTHYFPGKMNPADTNNFSSTAFMDVGGAFPGSKMRIVVLDTVYTIPLYYYKLEVPIFTKKIPEPEVKYNQGPFLQAVAPGTMHQYEPIILKNVGDDVSKITLSFFDNMNNVLDTAHFIKDPNGYRTWVLNYDMGKLWPPYSTFVFSMWAAEENEPLDTSSTYTIEMIRTRPLWMNNPNYVIYRDISETNDSVYFTLKLAIVPKNYEVTNNFGIPASFLLIGGGKLYQTGSLMEMPMAYSKSTRRLRKTGEPIESALVAQFKSGYLIGALEKLEYNKDKQNFKFAEEMEKTLDNEKNVSPEKSKGSWTFEPTFESKTTNKVDIDTNNLLTIMHKSKYEIGAHFDIPAIDAMIKELNASITAELAPWSALIRPVFGFAMELELYMAERKNLISDSLGNIQSTGVLELKGEKEGKEIIDDPENASYRAYGALFGMDFSLGAEIAMGAFGKVTVHFITEFPLTFVNMYNVNDKKLLSDLDFALYWQVDASIFFGLINISVVPKSLFYHGRILGDQGDFSVIYAKTKKDSKVDEFIQSKKGTLVNLDNLSNRRVVYPQPDMETRNGKTGMIWLEQSPETGYSTIVFSENSNDNSSFGLKKFIHTSSTNVNTPKFDYLSDDRILATWVQNRFDIKSLPNNKSGFELMQEVIKGQDIWYAVYDLSKDSLLSIGSLPDDKSTFTSGRTEGNPIVKGINENKGMIVWTVSDLANNESELYYSFVENNNDWTSTNGESICGNIPGSEINQTIGINSDGDIILSWINVSKDATKRQVMGSVYSNNSWTNCSVLADEPSGSKIRYMDMEFEANYGSLIWSEGRLDTDKDGDLIPMEKINFIKWNSNIKNWDKSTLITILDSNIKEAKEPNIEISNTGKIAVLYQNNEMRGPVRKVNAIYGDMNNTNNWKSDNENVLICDTNKRLYDFDFGFKGGDTLFVIKQENMTNSSFEVNKNIKNGNRFGATNSNLVLRTLMVGGTPTNVKTEDITKQIKDEEDGINVYPNPANDILNISFDNQSRVYSFDIFDSKGKLIQTEHYDVKGNDYSIDVSNLSTGMYFIQYNDNGTKKMKSFVVVR